MQSEQGDVKMESGGVYLLAMGYEDRISGGTWHRDRSMPSGNDMLAGECIWHLRNRTIVLDDYYLRGISAIEKEELI